MPLPETNKSLRMHIERIGNGPDLVMLHGWAMHAGIFSPVIDALSERYTLHLVDLPGHGRSRDLDGARELDLLATAVADRVPAGAAWLGWSLGGLIALKAAAERPDEVDRLIMVAAPPRFTSASHWPHGVDAAVFEEFAQDLATDFNATLQRFLALEVNGSDTARQDLRRLRADAFRHGTPDADALGAGLDLLRRADLIGELKELQIPVLFLGGRRDRLVPWRSIRNAASLAPEGSAEIIPGAGHAPFIGQPGAFLESVKRFLYRPLEHASGQ